MSQSAEELHDPDILPPWPVLAGFVVWMLSTAFVLLLLTPYTFSLDDIKIPGLYIGGALCLLVWAALWLTDQVDAPPRVLWVSYAAYLLFGMVSAAASRAEVQWIAWQYAGYNLSTLGFVLLGAGVLRTRKMVELALKFWVAIVLITTGFGLFHYSGLLGRFYGVLYPNGAPIAEDRFHDLLFTFKQSRSMLSTILNVQFFGNFLLMLLPVTGACVALVFQNLRRFAASGEGVIRPVSWTILSGLAVVFSLTCIFTTYSKSSIFLLPPVLLAFLGCIYIFTNVRRIPYLWLILLLGAVMAGSVLYFTIGDFRDQMKDLEENLAPRRIMFGGAWRMFLDNPVLGGGPGSFRVLFPEYRSPDYHLSRISNVTNYCHNWLLDLLAENGALGTIAYLAFLGGLCWLAWRALRQSPDMMLRIAVIGAILGAFSLLGGSMTTPMTRWPVGTVALHAMLGTAFGIAVFALKPVPKRSRNRDVYTAPVPPAWDHGRVTRGILVASALAYLIYITPWANRTFTASYYHNEGLKKTDLPDGYFSESGIATEPAVVDLMKRGIVAFNKAIELDPARPTTYYKLAHAYNRLADEENSLKQYLALQRFSPDYSEIHYNLGVIYYNMALDAREALDKAEKDGNSRGAEAARSRLIENFDKSIAQFERQSKLSNKVSVWYFWANVCGLKADALDPESPEAKALYLKAGEVQLRTSTLPISKVIQEVGQEEREQELRYRALRRAKDSFAKAGEPLRAAEAAEAFLKQVPSSLASLRDAVEYYEKAEKVDEALRLLDASLTRNPLNADALVMKVSVLLRNHREEEARREGRYALALDAAMQASGGGFLKSDEIEEIESLLDNTTTKDPKGK
jgi:tetratricopeptide (TPR) repeat protein